MIFRKEINPRDYTSFPQMMHQLQQECISVHGAGFNCSKIIMGQLQPNSELFWFEGCVDDAAAVNKASKAIPHCSAKEFIEVNTINGMISQRNAIDAISFDRSGRFVDSPSEKIINIHIASLGTFNIDSRQSAVDEVKKVTDALLKAINNIK